ncbi:agmatinase [Rhodococcoides kyotonense]|uniref:Agmatinase n=1 Tax=Rhodococcoides kyotonense TaxID=398843 RepID=A0A239N0R9_9NOCA|nr:agmatinase [Rhodococcus kyotonensis]SNT48617.1 agmatinase [Rhodococcus kyotonensis]
MSENSNGSSASNVGDATGHHHHGDDFELQPDHGHSHDSGRSWEQPRRLGSGLAGHGAVDDFNVDRKPGLIHVNRRLEGGFAGIQTYAKLPVCLTPDDLRAAEIDVAVCGVPWDATAGSRHGTNHGPLAIRQVDYKSGRKRQALHQTVRIDPFQILNVCDYGDSPIYNGNTMGTFEAVRKFVGTIPDAGAIPIIMGGDHGITWPTATAVADHYGYGKVGIVHFDAHVDASTEAPGTLGGHGTPMRKLIESGAIPGRNFVQVGLRGFYPDRPLLDFMDEHEMRAHFMAEIDHRGFDSVLERAVDEALDHADYLYISLDVDVADPAFAPGTGTPEPGGLTSSNVLRAIRRLSAEVGIVGMDVVEVSPAYDGPGQITSLMANAAIREAITGIAMRRVGITSPDYVDPGALGPDYSRARRNKDVDTDLPVSEDAR